ncbi:tRNA pseudouridine(38-40) synthase TruA [Motilimonas pumila]|uniref:tRNA pseudouridine synthase A n=1 Tax=Motilimonas pumila TaxID=2303987 RepID=A0A418YF56_9GAMM|nr:tRNA pseudouridine(38-40) synthase TruA [Motilimonas pumila]RJG47698.1 tRNA pseudouridine(38-40) synthase TruA [Motilimonas pumila]
MRVALGIEYDGANYYGWQKQLEVDTVQARLEAALTLVANETIEVQCAGRTDAGVHATGQLVHFDTHATRNERAWTLGINANLPKDIAVTWAKQVDSEFHARFSATARRYRYIIYNAPLRSGILGGGLSHYFEPLDANKMHQAAQYLLGEQDFTSFRAAHCQSNTPFRNIHHVNVKRFGPYIVIDIKANAFLHHMVRNITGSLIEVGKGKQDIDWLKHLLTLKDRGQAAATAKANGLYLVDVDYPSEFNLPRHHIGPLFLPNEQL